MAGRLWQAALVFMVLLAATRVADAGPYLGEWSWHWHPAHDCPRGEYSCLHYWLPGIYKVRACVHPSNLDQYPPGPSPPPAAEFQFTPYPCRSTPPAPTAPYVGPAAYFGRPVTLPFALP